MYNFSNIINENILKNYAMNIYMFEGEYFMIYLKRDSSIIQSEIKFYKNKCLNLMLQEKSENMSGEEVEEFANNYKIGEKNIFKIYNDNIKLKDFFEVVNDKKKIKNSNINNYDLILLESFDKRNENDSTIPNKKLLTIFIDILNCNGIFAYILRYEAYNEYSIILAKLQKKYKRVIEIELRIGSKFIICCPDKNVKMINYYRQFDNIIDKRILKEIEQKLV